MKEKWRIKVTRMNEDDELTRGPVENEVINKH